MQSQFSSVKARFRGMGRGERGEGGQCDWSQGLSSVQHARCKSHCCLNENKALDKNAKERRCCCCCC